MIHYRKGDIFDSEADCIFNTVNCEGFMGKGIAYQFKQRFPENNKKYIEYCKEGKLHPGVLLPFEEKGRTIINFPTKDKWRNPSQMQYIIDGLDAFVKLVPKLSVKKTAIPPLGCGNGGLKWANVKQVIEKILHNIDLEIEVFEPSTGDDVIAVNEQMTVYDLLLLHARENLECPNLLRFQKTFFFANHYSNVKMFSFSRGRFGPYSRELYQSAKKLRKYKERNGLSDAKQTYKAIYEVICSKRVDDQYRKLSSPVDKALELVNSTQDELLLEGMATSLYLIENEQVVQRNKIVEEFKAWSDDKASRFNEAAIQRSLKSLESWGIVQKNLFDFYEVIH